jgi:hypothetical protein
MTFTMGDGSGNSGWSFLQSSFTHVYGAPGTYTVNATLGFTDGTTLASNVLTVAVTASYNSLVLSAIPTTVTIANNPVFFTATYNGPNIISYCSVFDGQGGNLTETFAQMIVNYNVFVDYGYATNGTYTARSQIFFTDGTNMTSNYVVITVGVPSVTSALVLAAIPTTTTGLVNFAWTYSGSKTVNHYNLTYGNGATAPYLYPSAYGDQYIYMTNGTFVASITAYFVDGTNLASNYVTITVGGAIAHLSVSASPNPTTTGSVSFTVLYSGMENIDHYVWVYGDGNSANSTGYIQLYIYVSNGTFPASVTAEFSDGTSMSAYVSVTVSITQPSGTLWLTASPNPAAGPTVLSATYNGSKLIEFYQWFSGDGQGTSTFPPQNYWGVTYTVNGTDTAMVIVFFSDGANQTAMVSVVIAIPAGTPAPGPGPAGLGGIGAFLVGAIGTGGLWLAWVCLSFTIGIVLAGMGANIMVGLMAGFPISGVLMWLLDPADMMGAALLGIVLAILMGIAGFKSHGPEGGGSNF